LDVYLTSFLEILQTTGDLDKMLERALAHLVTESGFTAGFLILFEPAVRQVYIFPEPVAGASHPPMEIPAQGHLLRELRDTCARMPRLMTLEELMRQETIPDVPLFHGALEEKAAESVILPLRSRENIFGVIKLTGHISGVPLDTQRRAFLDLVGRQMGKELGRELILLKEQGLVRERHVLLDIGKIIISGLDLEETLSHIVQTSMQRMGLNRCAIQIIDEEDHVKLIYASDMDDPGVVFVRENELDVDFMGEAGRLLVREQEIVYVEDARSDPRTNNQFAQAFSMVSVLGVPILSSGKAIGFILTDEPGQYHYFSEEDIRIMEGIAAFAAIAIENARLYRESRDQQVRLADLMLRLARAREEERSRISRELHDSMAQTLLEIIYRAEGLLGTATGDHLQQELRGMLQSSRASLAELRRIITDLRPSSVEVLGLSRALANLLERFAVTYHLQVDKEIDEGLQLDSLYENSLFRIVQEALNNISRHASAARVSFSLRRGEGSILLEISDDGSGFDTASVSGRGGLGLIFMRERAEMMGGSFAIDSRAGRGTTLTLEVPL
jgi:signal transduction histidine kinase